MASSTSSPLLEEPEGFVEQGIEKIKPTPLVLGDIMVNNSKEANMEKNNLLTPLERQASFPQFYNENDESNEFGFESSVNLRKSIKDVEHHVGFGGVDVAPSPKKKIGFGVVAVADQPPEPPEETKFEDLPLRSKKFEEHVDSYAEEEEENPDDHADSTVERYFEVAERFAADKTFDVKRENMPSRSPYEPGKKMMHGAHYFQAFKRFLLNGGCGFYKNTVMLNIRMNNISELDVMAGTCKLNFFLDCAFWVPEFDEEHYADAETIGSFAMFEPVIGFPEMKELQWLKRTVEFSKHPGARRHEVQLGQNFETAKTSVSTQKTNFVVAARRNSGDAGMLKKRPSAPPDSNSPVSPVKRSNSLQEASLMSGGGAPGTTEKDDDLEPLKVEMKPLKQVENEQQEQKQTEVPVNAMKTGDLWKKSIQRSRRPTLMDAVNSVSSAKHAADAFTANLHRSATNKEAAGHASDSCAHWPRMWRVLISEEDLEAFNKMSKSEKKKVEPTNSKPENVPPNMRELLLRLDAQREHDLGHPLEGIVYSTYEIGCLSRQTYELFDFPFDLQDLDIVVRLDAHKADPLKRHIIPCAHDKGFFCSSRVPPLTEWVISKNLDWYVEKGVGGNASLDGGKERLVASILVLRKSYYYSRHYIFILFLMTTSVFSIFTIEADQIEARSNIVFSLLLTVVAFNYSCSESIPKVPYATVLEVFINFCFLSVLAVGGITFAFSYLEASKNGYYNKSAEQWFGLGLFVLWCIGNAYHWYDIFSRTEKITKVVEEDEQIGWLKFKEKKSDDKLNQRTRGLQSVKTEPQLPRLMKRATSIDGSSLTLKKTASTNEMVPAHHKKFKDVVASEARHPSGSH